MSGFRAQAAQQIEATHLFDRRSVCARHPGVAHHDCEGSGPRDRHVDAVPIE